MMNKKTKTKIIALLSTLSISGIANAADTTISFNSYKNLNRFAKVDKKNLEDSSNYAYEGTIEYKSDSNGFVYVKYLDGKIENKSNFVISDFSAYGGGIGLTELVSKKHFDIDYKASLGMEKIKNESFLGKSYDKSSIVYNFGGDIKNFFYGWYVPLNIVHYGNLNGKDTFFEYGIGYTHEMFDIKSTFSDDFEYKLTFGFKF